MTNQAVYSVLKKQAAFSSEQSKVSLKTALKTEIEISSGELHPTRY
jgi:hypothetical protein